MGGEVPCFCNGGSIAVGGLYSIAVCPGLLQVCQYYCVGEVGSQNVSGAKYLFTVFDVCLQLQSVVLHCVVLRSIGHC